MNTKQFAFAALCFAVLSLSALSGLTFLFCKILVPPARFDTLVSNYIGRLGPITIVIVSFALGVALAYFLVRKFLVPRFAK